MPGDSQPWKTHPQPVRASSQLPTARSLRAERDENLCRKEMLPSEKVDLARAIEELVKEQARQRMDDGRKAGGRGKKKPSVHIDGGFNAGESREIIASAVGLAVASLAKAKACVTDPPPNY